MTASQTLLTFPNGRQLVLGRAREQITKMPCYRDGVLVDPTSGTLSLVGPTGTVLATPAVTIVGNIAQATYTAVMLPITLGFGEGYTEQWLLVIDGIEVPVRRLAIMSRFELHPPVAFTDITEGEYPDLLQQLGDYSTTADGGSQLQAFMDRSWEGCLRHLWRLGTPSVLIVDSSDVFDWLRHEVLARTFKALLGMQANDRWQKLWDFHREEARAAKTGVKPIQDRDQSGTPDNVGRQPVAMSVHPNMPPRRRTRFPGRW